MYYNLIQFHYKTPPPYKCCHIIVVNAHVLIGFVTIVRTMCGGDPGTLLGEDEGVVVAEGSDRDLEITI